MDTLKAIAHATTPDKSRRNFLAHLSIGCIGLPLLSSASWLPTQNSSDLHNISNKLLQDWCDALIKYQIDDTTKPHLHGGIICPACARIHGRCGDAIYPMLHMAKHTGDKKYLNAALNLFTWTENNVILPNGAFINDVNVSSWTGITVFSVISLCEALANHGDLLSQSIRDIWLRRLRKATDYVHRTFHIEFSNINYPLTAIYALWIVGELFDDSAYKQHAQKMAAQAHRFFTSKDKLLFGEGGGDRYTISPKGCLPVDLGYNVEESLPALAMYALKANDNALLEVVTQSLKTSMEFMLPDGAWDNSWGTRSFKWSYWGSRTSDGCQPAYALLADKHPSFYNVALSNTKLLAACTHNGLLNGGPHYDTHGIAPCIHHTFAHAKALATILDNNIKYNSNIEIKPLPREITYGIREFADINTWLISTNNWLGTITGYDREYKFKNGHPSGGALSMLYHRQLGPILSSSMNSYQLIESTNMQAHHDPHSFSLTSRLQTKDGKYMNISDLKASITHSQQHHNIVVETHSQLVNGEQKLPSQGTICCDITYTFTPKKTVHIDVSHDTNDELVEFILPIISKSNEIYEVINANSIAIKKAKGTLIIKSNKPIQILPTLDKKKRIFNHVPGMEALPLQITGNNISIELYTI
ncbi:hypothetical protein EYV94_04290 [Puteibacter caeruleilacunae]|nr:hypothetical protein EYV94_04290 [Puteibacter caeruleilacunae]